MADLALTQLSLAQMVAGLEAGSFTAAELAEAHLAAGDAARDLNCFITQTHERTRAMAAASDARRRAGTAGTLEGVPIAVKDLFCTEGVRTTAASHILENFVPPYESSVTQRLWDAGAVMLHKANLDEFAMGSSNATSYFGPVKSPWSRPGDTAPRVPGGSSGGSASAVAARLAPAATGTDTGGSIRQPAAFCGIVGVKPTYGRCSRYGIVAFSSSLDQAGAFARNVEDSALVLQAMCGHDPKDSTSIDRPLPDLRAAAKAGVKGLRVGIPREYRLEGTAPAILKLWDEGIAWLRAAGMEPVEISLPHTHYALPTYYVIAPAEASSNLARYDGVRYGLRVAGGDLKQQYSRSRGEGFGAEVRRRIIIGTYVLSAGYFDAYFKKAQQVRALIADDFAKAFERCDAILTPTAPTPAFVLGETSDDPIAMYLNDVFTVPASLAGLPGLSVPAGLDDGLPLGLQVLARPFDEATLFQVAGALEDAAGFTAKPGI